MSNVVMEGNKSSCPLLLDSSLAHIPPCPFVFSFSLSPSLFLTPSLQIHSLSPDSLPSETDLHCSCHLHAGSIPVVPELAHFHSSVCVCVCVCVCVTGLGRTWKGTV